jgi:hypothetical protein
MSEGVIGGNEATVTPAAMAVRVQHDAQRAFGDVADDVLLERYARDAVDDLWQDSIKVKTFVPVLALRQIRDMLEEADRGRPGGAGAG